MGAAPSAADTAGTAQTAGAHADRQLPLLSPETLMQRLSTIALALAGLALAGQASAEITLFGQEGFQGQSYTTSEPVNNLARTRFNDRASSVEVRGEPSERWEVCEDRRFRGRCVVLRPGPYPSLSALGLNDRVSSVRSVDRYARIAEDRYAPTPAAPTSQVVFYEREGFRGRSFTTDQPLTDFRRSGFNDSASSLVVTGQPWEVCEDQRFQGRCAVLRPGQYASLRDMGLNDRVSSVRTVRNSDDRSAPAAPVAVDNYRRRPEERVYAAPVTSVRAVVEDSGQRCWMEQEKVVQERKGANGPGAVLGALIGGVLGHQVGGGTGKDVATGLGVVAGAAIGAHSGAFGGDQRVVTQDVQRCETNAAQARPAYWDVTYSFRGVEHHMQMDAPPGDTVLVNEQGEPRT
jgi:uncharacterized protein YcfJ